jgi:hypothetical protein
MMNYKKEILAGVAILVVIAAVAVVWGGMFFPGPVNTAAILLPSATTGVHYAGALQVANATLPAGTWEVTSTSGQLPPGLTVEHFEHGCIPTEPACPQNSFDLLGTPTRAGTYTFSVTFSIGGNPVIQAYQVRVLP